MSEYIVERLRKHIESTSPYEADLLETLKEAVAEIESLRKLAGSVSMLDQGFREITKDIKRDVTASE